MTSCVYAMMIADISKAFITEEGGGGQDQIKGIEGSKAGCMFKLTTDTAGADAFTQAQRRLGNESTKLHHVSISFERELERNCDPITARVGHDVSHTKNRLS